MFNFSLSAGNKIFSRSELVRIKIRAIRSGVWFKVLSQIERAQLDLTIRVVDRVRSCLLRRLLASIVRKIHEALESPIRRLIREIGVALARRVCAAAERIGCKKAWKWAEDKGFVQFLTITYMNTHRLYRIPIENGLRATL